MSYVNKQALYIGDVYIKDPHTLENVCLEVFKHPTEGLFAINSNYTNLSTDIDTWIQIADPLSNIIFISNEHNIINLVY